jgi:hypothetical protein
MESVILKSNSKKDLNLLINLAKKIGVEVKKVSSKKHDSDKNSVAYEEKVERNLVLLMKEGMKSGIASPEDIEKVLGKWK